MEFDQLKTVIAGILSLDPNEITEEETFVEDLGADSLDLFQIVMEVFQIKIPPREAEKITKVGEALALVHQMVEIKEQAAEHDNL